MNRSTTVLAALLLLVFSTEAFGQDSVAVIALDDGSASRKTASRMAEMLLSSGRTVSFGEPVYERFTNRLVPESPSVASKFQDFDKRVEAGVQAYFSKGESKAIESLSPLFQIGLAEFGYVSAQPKLAEAVFETGVILMRAYDGLGRQAERDATAQLVAKYFPAREPSLEKSPPHIVEGVRAAKAELYRSGARLGVEAIGGKACKALMNGVEVGDGAFPVAANTDIFVQAQCEEGRGPLLRVSVKPGESLMALVPLEPITDDKMPDDSFESRRKAEVRLRVLRFWGGFDEVVGVRTPVDDPESDDATPTLFAHLQSEKVTWTETVGVPAFVGFVEETFQLSEPEKASESSVDYLAWGLVSGGVVAIGTGIGLYFVGRNQTQALICSGYATEQPAPGDCDGVDDLGPLTRSDFESRVTTADTFLVSGVVAMGVGAGVLTWGIVRLATGSDEAQIAVSPTLRGVQVRGTW